MTDILKEDATNPEWLRIYDHSRFVRIGNVFYYTKDYMQNHASIAIENGATEMDRDHRPIVDDAGEIEVVNGKLAFGGFSIGCAYRKGSFENARPETDEVAKKIFGEENIY